MNEPLTVAGVAVALILFGVVIGRISMRGKMLCRRCLKPLKVMTFNSHAELGVLASLMAVTVIASCENSECEDYGYVVTRCTKADTVVETKNE